MRYQKKLVLLILLFHLTTSNEICQWCKNKQNQLRNKAFDAIDSFLENGEKICGLIIPKSICEHYVIDLGFTSFKGMLDLYEQKNILCKTFFCPEDEIEIFEASDFEDYVRKNFPKPEKFEATSSLKNLDNGVEKNISESNFSVLAISDVHLQRSYKPGTKVDCGLPAGCCSAKSGMPNGNERSAGYWGTRESNCDIPDHTFLKSLDYMKGNFFDLKIKRVLLKSVNIKEIKKAFLVSLNISNLIIMRFNLIFFVYFRFLNLIISDSKS